MTGHQVRNYVDIVSAWIVVFIGTSFLAAWTRGRLWLGVALTAVFVLAVIALVGRRVDRRTAAARDAAIRALADRDDDGAK